MNRYKIGEKEKWTHAENACANTELKGVATWVDSSPFYCKQEVRNIAAVCPDGIQCETRHFFVLYEITRTIYYMNILYYLLCLVLYSTVHCCPSWAFVRFFNKEAAAEGRPVALLVKILIHVYSVMAIWKITLLSICRTANARGFSQQSNKVKSDAYKRISLMLATCSWQ